MGFQLLPSRLSIIIDIRFDIPLIPVRVFCFRPCDFVGGGSDSSPQTHRCIHTHTHRLCFLAWISSVPLVCCNFLIGIAQSSFRCPPPLSHGGKRTIECDEEFQNSEMAGDDKKKWAEMRGNNETWREDRCWRNENHKNKERKRKKKKRENSLETREVVVPELSVH